MIRIFEQPQTNEIYAQCSVSRIKPVSLLGMATRGPYTKSDAQSRLRIRDARVKAGFTQESLSEALNISQPTLARWERGKVDITVKQLLQLAEILDVPPAELVEDGDGLTDRERGLIESLRSSPRFWPIVSSTLDSLKDAFAPNLPPAAE